MILVLLGTQPLPFTRLITELIALHKKGSIGESEIVIQAGCTTVDYPAFKTFEFIEKQQLNDYIQRADLVITHGGAGSMFDALRAHKKVIALARQQKLGEHLDDHQFELVDMLFAEKYLIGCHTLHESFGLLDNFSFKTYHSNQKKIINHVLGWINELQ